MHTGFEKVLHCPARYCPALQLEDCVQGTQLSALEVVLPVLQVLLGA